MDDNLQMGFEDNPEAPQEYGDVVRVEQDALKLDLKDSEFIETLEDYHKTYDKFCEKINLYDRQETMKKYLFGKQLDGKKLKDYEEEQQFLDNIIYEAESYIVPMALSRLPDIVVKPGTDTIDSKQTAEKLGKVVSDDIKTRERKRVLKLAFKQQPVYLYSVLKAFWDPTKGNNGDFNFKAVHPRLIKFDISAFYNDATAMDWISENIEYTVKEWVNRFPDKEQKIYEELKKMGHFSDKMNEKSYKGMNSKVKGWETHFTWTDKKGDGKFERTECIAWTLNKLVLMKMKTPNWDWQGDEAVFSYQGDDEPADLNTLMGVMETAANGELGILGQLQPQKIFYNYLPYPQKPFFFMGYDQWGENPIDATSRIEQVIQLQKNYDKRGTQITSMLDRARGKHVFSADQGLKKEELEALDMSDPNSDLYVKGKVNEVHAFIQPELPSPAQIQDKDNVRERIFDKMGVHGPARGEVDQGAPATNNQLSREGDFTRSDDLTDDTINAAAEWMAQWEMQFMKLRYTQDHFKRISGDDGKYIFEKVNRDMIDDGMIAVVGASGTDKLKAEQRAMDTAKLGYIDPISFYTDLGMSDPKGRAEKLYLWKAQPDMYAQQFIYSGNQGPMPPTGNVGATAQQAQEDIMAMQSGQVPPPPVAIDPTYAHTFQQFMDDPQGMEAVINQFPQNKQALLAFAQQIANLAQQMVQSNQQSPVGSANPQPGQPPSGGMGAANNQSMTPTNSSASVGPVNSRPQPGNTAQVATMPPGRV